MSPPTTGSSLLNWRKAWSAWARGAGLDVAWAKQSDNPPERHKPYVRLEILTMETVNTDELGAVFDATKSERREFIQGLRQITLNVQVVANATPELEGSAWAWADELLGTLKSEDVADMFRQAGLAVSNTGIISDLGALEQSQFVSRVTFDVVFIGAYYRLSPTTGGWVNRIIGEGDLEGNSSPEITFDVEGP